MPLQVYQNMFTYVWFCEQLFNYPCTCHKFVKDCLLALVHVTNLSKTVYLPLYLSQICQRLFTCPCTCHKFVKDCLLALVPVSNLSKTVYLPLYMSQICQRLFTCPCTCLSFAVLNAGDICTRTCFHASSRSETSVWLNDSLDVIKSCPVQMVQ